MSFINKLKSSAGRSLALALAASVLTVGSANAQAVDTQADFTPYAEENEIGVSDPFEGFNRAVFDFNEGIDNVFIEPLARGYRYVTPKPLRTGVNNFTDNLASPIYLANQILQGDVEGIGDVLGRAIINTTLGIGGLFDVANYFGLEREPEDFGQTLAVWGLGNGPYIVMPLFGPSTLRDATGFFVDSYADPVRLYLFNTDREDVHFVRVGVTVLAQREQLLDVLEDLQKNSFDYYAALRSAYIQRRNAVIVDNRPNDGGTLSIPDYDDEDFN